MSRCKDCNVPTTDTNHEGTAFQCDECAHNENLVNAFDEAEGYVREGYPVSTAIAKASIHHDVTIAQLAAVLDSCMVTIR